MNIDPASYTVQPTLLNQRARQSGSPTLREEPRAEGMVAEMLWTRKPGISIKIARYTGYTGYPKVLNEREALRQHSNDG